MIEKLKSFKWGYELIFLVLSAIGVLCIVFPETLKIVCITAGIILALYAAVLFVLTLVKRERQAGFAVKIVIAGISLAAGIVMAILNQKAVAVLTSLLGLYMVIDGSFKLQTTVLSKRYKVAAWWIMLSLAIIVIAGGFISLKWTPTEDNAAWTSRILGVTLIVDGIANLLTPFFTPAYEKKMIKEIKDTLSPVEPIPDAEDGIDNVADGSAEIAHTDDPVIISIDGAESVDSVINDEK